MSQEFTQLLGLELPYQPGDQLLVVRGNQTYRGSLHPSIALSGDNGSADLSWALFQIRHTDQSGGSFHPPNQWLVRPFNFKTAGFGTINAFGQIALEPGSYCFRGWSTGMENGRMRSRFRSIDSLITWYGATAYSLHYSWHIPIEGVFAIAQPTTFVLEMWCDRDRNKPWGYGYESGISPELYGSLLFFRKPL
ncbi:MAG: hypothetical protein ACFB2W_28335 [Leptolyngbyaceae cyanobacterium]